MKTNSFVKSFAGLLAWLLLLCGNVQAGQIATGVQVTFVTAAVLDSLPVETELFAGTLPVASLKPHDFTKAQPTTVHCSGAVVIKSNGVRVNASSLTLTAASFKATKRNVVTGVTTTVVQANYGVFNQTASPQIIAKAADGTILTAVNNHTVVGTNIADVSIVEILDLKIPLTSSGSFTPFALLPGERYEILFTFSGSCTVNGNVYPIDIVDQAATAIVLPNVQFDSVNLPSTTAKFLVEGIMHPSYVIEVSDDLALWTPVSIINSVSTGPNSSSVTTSWPVAVQNNSYVRLRHPSRAEP